MSRASVAWSRLGEILKSVDATVLTSRITPAASSTPITSHAVCRRSSGKLADYGWRAGSPGHKMLALRPIMPVTDFSDSSGTHGQQEPA